MTLSKGIRPLLIVFSCIGLLGCDFINGLLEADEEGDDSGATRVDGGSPTQGDATATEQNSQTATQPQLCAGESHTCALKPSGEILCWGRNSDGQLGDGTALDRLVPVPVVELNDATQITCGYQHTCARRRSGAVSCWGQSSYGQLGNGSTDPTQRPVNVSGVDDAVEVSAGRDFSCLRRASGSVMCFGRNNDGQLGNGTTNDSPTPVDVMTISNAEAIRSGYGHTCALRAGNQASCWGRDNSRQLGRGGSEFRSTSPIDVAGIDGTTVIAAGGNHSCVIATSGVMCWGQNNHGQVGNGQTGSGTVQEIPSPVQGLTGTITALSLGEQHSCAIVEGGTVKCWGYNGSRQLGHGSQGDQAQPVDVQGLTAVVDVAAGYSHTCALTQDGQIYCWGSANRGQLGRGERTHAPTPQPLDGVLETLAPPPSTIPNFAAAAGAQLHITPHIALGSSHVCTALPDGRVSCFGQGGDGQLGHGATSPLASDSGVAVPALSDAVEVAAYGSRTCVRRASGEVACWGARLAGLNSELGSNSSLPVPVPGIDDAAEIAVGGSMVCVRRRTGGVSCWGENNAGQLGTGTRDSSETPVAVQGLTDAVQLAAAQTNICARRQGDTLVCWGSQYRGALGTGTDQAALSPVEVPGLRDVTDIAGSSHTFCAVHNGGRVSCWGANDDGQLGSGQSGRESDQNSPVAIRSLRNVARVGLGGGTACVVFQNGSARCWGANDFGQTGHNDTDTDDVTSPWEVLSSQDASVGSFGPYTFLGCGVNYCCGLHGTGNISCQGSTPIRGSSGFLGLGNRRSPIPISVPGLVVREVGEAVEEPPTPAADAGTPPTTTEAGPATPPTQAPTVDAGQRPPRPGKRPVRPECARVRYHNCRIIYNQYGQPQDVCECSPAFCCPGGRRQR